LSDEQDDSHSLVGWVLGIAVTIAIAVAVIIGVMSAMNQGSGAPISASAPTTTLAAPTATSATAGTENTAPANPVVSGSPAAAKVYFDSNSASTPAGTASLLEALVAYSKTSPNTKLSISGFHDKTGDADKNHELAKKRAMGVRDLLIAAGVPEDRIMLQKPVETTGGGDDREARRVEVNVAQ
jgi:outer membrane protein OmpA-like peptidoglycan-associated protein